MCQGFLCQLRKYLTEVLKSTSRRWKLLLLPTELGAVLVLTTILAATTGTFPRVNLRIFPLNRESYHSRFLNNDGDNSRFSDDCCVG